VIEIQGKLSALLDQLASDLRRVGSLLLAGLLGAVSWCFIRRNTKGESSDRRPGLERRGAPVFPRSPSTSLISEMVIGMGTSIRRETALNSRAAPRAACSRPGHAALPCNVVTSGLCRPVLCRHVEEEPALLEATHIGALTS
jgi:hypothetical protein